MRLAAPLLPPPLIHWAMLPPTEKVRGEGKGVQVRSCCRLTVAEVIVLALPAVFMVITPRALVVPVVCGVTRMGRPLAAGPVALAVMLTSAPLWFAM